MRSACGSEIDLDAAGMVKLALAEDQMAEHQKAAGLALNDDTATASPRSSPPRPPAP